MVNPPVFKSFRRTIYGSSY